MKFWLKILALIKQVNILYLFAAALIGAATVFIGKHDKKIIKDFQKLSADSILVATVNKTALKVDSLYVWVKEVRVDQMVTNIRLKTIADTVSVVRRGVGDLFYNLMSKQDFRDWSNAFEKKNENSIYPTVLSPKK
jgi:hypothetical protein